MHRKVALALTALAVLLAAPQAPAATTATTATLSTVFAAASAGDVIRLAPGTYGSRAFNRTFPADNRVVITGPRSAHMSLNFSGSSTGLTFQNFTLEDALFNSANAEDLTLSNLDVPGQVVVRQDAGIENSRIVIRDSDFHDWNSDPTTYEGRLSVCGCGANALHNGITIRDNVFRGGASDGIQDSGSGTKIIHNEFFGIHSDDSTGVHADPIQTWDGCCHVIAGNYFHDLPGVSVLMMPDGINSERIVDNVVAADPSMYPYAFTVFADHNSIIRHNTLAFADNACAFSIDCGGIRMGTKGPVGSGTKVDHNIVGWINNETGTSSIRADNLVASGGLVGNEVRGQPTYAGGANPSTYCGYALTAGSLGQGWGARTDRYCP